MKDDDPKIINGHKIISSRNLNSLMKNQDEYPTFENRFNNFFIYSDKLIKLATENNKIREYEELINKIKIGIPQEGNGTIYLKDFITDIYNITIKS